MKKPMALLVVAAGVTLTAGVAWSAIPNSSTGSIAGCYSKTTGALRVIDKQAGKRCKSYERELAWQQAGAQGTQGAQGTPGAQGPQGAQGTPGAQGAQGPGGPAGSPGGSGQGYRVVDANGVDLGALVRAPDDDNAPIPGDPIEFQAGRSVIVQRVNGTFAEYDAGNGAVPRHGELLYFTANCTGAAYVRLADLTTGMSFYGIPPLEVDSTGSPVRGLTVTGAAVEPTSGHALLSARTLGESGCIDLSAFPRIGPEHTVKAATSASYMPVDVPGPLRIATP